MLNEDKKKFIILHLDRDREIIVNTDAITIIEGQNNGYTTIIRLDVRRCSESYYVKEKPKEIYDMIYNNDKSQKKC